jgi:transposase
MVSPPSHSQSVLPDPHVLVLKNIVRSESKFILYVSARQAAICPSCGRVSRSRHSSYVRRLQDLPWQGQTVEILLSAGRYRCRHRDCPRKIFTERLPLVAPSYSRHTTRLAEVVRLVGYAVGGLPGQRLLERLAVCVSDDTVIRRIKTRPANPAVSTVHHLGVDDWAWRKGQDYGTILVDLDRRQGIDLLADRSSELFRAWLESHEGVTLIARDRSGAYAEAASLGAPEAQQVADRFHLLLNLSAAVERAFEERSRQLLLPPPGFSEDAVQTPTEVPDIGAAAIAQQERKMQRRQRRLLRYQQVVELYRQGHSAMAISRALQIERKTVRRWLRAGQFPERKPPQRRPAKVREFAEHLQRRWEGGCHDATTLFHEIRQLGYRGGRSMVAQFVAGWRKSGKTGDPGCPQRIAPRQAAILAGRPADRLSASQQFVLERLALECPDSVRIRRMCLDFREALFSGESNQLRQWIERVKRSEIGALVRFAWGLTKDLRAVSAAVDTTWSSGQVEGQINRLKMLKRQMYGRAGFTLLRARVLPYSPMQPTRLRAP